MSNYYEVLGVWRDASAGEIDLAAQVMYEHWEGALAENDPAAKDWLEIVHQARATLLDPAARRAYDEELENAPEEEDFYDAGFPWRPYVCTLLAVPVMLSAFIVVLAAIASRSALTSFRAVMQVLRA